MKLIKQRSPHYTIGYWLEVFNIFTENMNYLVSVWSDRMKAEEVYTQLESANFLMESISILGKGYKTAEEFGFIDPIEIGRKQAFSMSYWLVPGD